MADSEEGCNARYTPSGLPIVPRELIDEIVRDIRLAGGNGRLQEMANQTLTVMRSENPHLYELCQRLAKSGDDGISSGMVTLYSILERAGNYQKTFT